MVQLGNSCGLGSRPGSSSCAASTAIVLPEGVEFTIPAIGCGMKILAVLNEGAF